MTDAKRLLGQQQWGHFVQIVPDTGTSDHWWWLGAHDNKGYGQWWDRAALRTRRAHRLVYEAIVGPIPDDLTLDHLCREHGCVRPGHLEPVTNVENVMRGNSLPAQNARKDACDRGHPFSDENTYIHPTTGFRYCRTCRKDRAQERRNRNVARLADYLAAVEALAALFDEVTDGWGDDYTDPMRAADAALARLRESVPA